MSQKFIEFLIFLSQLFKKINFQAKKIFLQLLLTFHVTFNGWPFFVFQLLVCWKNLSPLPIAVNWNELFIMLSSDKIIIHCKCEFIPVFLFKLLLYKIKKYHCWYFVRSKIHCLLKYKLSSLSFYVNDLVNPLNPRVSLGK